MAAMDNFNRPAGGDPRDHQPTEQFWPSPGVPPGGPGPGNDHLWQQAGPQAHPASNRSKTKGGKELGNLICDIENVHCRGKKQRL